MDKWDSQWPQHFGVGKMLKTLPGLIQALQRPVIINTPTYDGRNYLLHDWINLTATSHLDVQVMQNICDGHQDLGEIILEYSGSRLTLGAAVAYREECLEKSYFQLMAFQYDQKKDVVFWHDDKGQHFEFK